MKTMELLDRIKMVRTKKPKPMTQSIEMTPVRRKAIRFIRMYHKHIPESYFADKTNVVLLCWVNPMDRNDIRREFEVEGTLNN